VLSFNDGTITKMRGEGQTMHKPGRYPVRGTVTHSAGASCVELSVVVMDVDECAAGLDNCGDDAQCVNTEGAFECQTRADGKSDSCLHLGAKTCVFDTPTISPTSHPTQRLHTLVVSLELHRTRTHLSLFSCSTCG
jgi:hypothetical protein